MKMGDRTQKALLVLLVVIKNTVRPLLLKKRDMSLNIQLAQRYGLFGLKLGAIIKKYLNSYERNNYKG